MIRHLLLLLGVLWTTTRRAGSFVISPIPSIIAPPHNFGRLISASQRSPGGRKSLIRHEAAAQTDQNDDDDHDDSPNIHESEITSTRRDVLVNAARAAAIATATTATVTGNELSSSTPPTPRLVPAANAVVGSSSSSTTPKKKKTILLTGGNSGIGYQAALRLANEGHTCILPSRTLEKSIGAVKSLKSQMMMDGAVGDSNSNDNFFVPAECDLSNLSSIESFVKESLPSLLDQVGARKLDTVCLNAGLARNTAATDVARTKDGFELTVGTNHFGHFYLTQLLLPFIDPTSGTIVVTASGVHDPESPGGAQGEKATLGDLRGLERDGAMFEMVDGGPFNADKAYKDSKLCNVLFTRELQRRLSLGADTRNICANCFNPGLIVSTGLFRDQNPFFTKAFDFAATDLLKVGETPAWGGGCLAYMTTIRTKGLYYSSAPGSSKYGDDAYGNRFSTTTPSKEASDDSKAKRLWDLSATLVGISS